MALLGSTVTLTRPGPVSVTVHIKDVAEHVQEVLESLHDMYTSSPLMSTFVDVHLVVDVFERQFNTWRNIARLFARTDFVMMLDIDFYPCTDFALLSSKAQPFPINYMRGVLLLSFPHSSTLISMKERITGPFLPKKLFVLSLNVFMYIQRFAPGSAPAC